MCHAASISSGVGDFCCVCMGRHDAPGVLFSVGGLQPVFRLCLFAVHVSGRPDAPGESFRLVLHNDMSVTFGCTGVNRECFGHGSDNCRGMNCL